MAKHETLRARFEAELHDVVSTNTRIANRLRNEDRDIPKDWTEMGQLLENDEVLEALETRTRQRVDELRRAISRIDAGTYDTCSSCGKEIEAGRLDVLPTTSLCAACASKLD